MANNNRPRGPLGLPRLTSIGPLVTEEEKEGLLVLDSHFDLSRGPDIVYHVAEKEDIPNILDNGLIGSTKPFEERKGGEAKGMGELMGPEDKFSPGIEAQRRLNEALNESKNIADSGVPRTDASELPNREGAVFFFDQPEDVAFRGKSLDDPIIVAVDFSKIPCASVRFKETRCVSARIEPADELFEMFFNESKEQAPVDLEKEEKLAMQYWNSARYYTGGRTRGDREIYCACNTPPEAIVELAQVSRMPQDVEVDFIPD